MSALASWFVSTRPASSSRSTSGLEILLGVAAAAGVVLRVVEVVGVDIAEPAHHQHVEVSAVLLVEPGGEVDGADVHRDAKGGKVIGDDLGRGHRLRIFGGDQHVEVLRRRVRLVQQALGLLDVVVVLAVVGVDQKLPLGIAS